MTTPEEEYEERIRRNSIECMMARDRVANRASALSIILGKNVKKYHCFENEIKMWVYEEMIGERKLSDIINEEHENVKYPSNCEHLCFPSQHVSSWL